MDAQPAIEGGDLPPVKFNLQGKFPEDVLSKLSISELKGLCRQQGLPVGGKKSDLVERLS